MRTALFLLLLLPGIGEPVLAAENDAGSDTDTQISAEAAEPVPAFDETITVSASRRSERISEAPVAVSVITPEAGAQTAHGQLPRLLDGVPGAELTQGGLFDFNLNVRGFNTSLNRRILVLVDGRDPAMGFFGAQEWANFPSALQDVESIELVRGPAAALYGANTMNGVLNIVTRPPGSSAHGHAQVSAGELDTARAELGFSSPLGEKSRFKLGLSGQRSDDFTRSRIEAGEYAGLPLEVLPAGAEKVEVGVVHLRLDRDLTADTLVTAAAGESFSDGNHFVTTAGRFLRESEERWYRAALTSDRWSITSSHSRRVSDHLQLNTGDEPFIDSRRSHVETRFSDSLGGQKLFYSVGASFDRTEIDTADETGRQTELLEPVSEERIGIYGQLDYYWHPKARMVIAARWDDSEHHDGQFSPRLGVVIELKPGHNLRLSYNEAFRAPTLAELFIQVGVAPALDLSALESALAPALGDVALGFAEIPVLALGNSELDVEEIRSLELGYSGNIGSKTSVQANIYRSELKSFVSSVLPQLGTSLGRINPFFGPYSPPSALSDESSALVLDTLQAALPADFFAILSNNVDGSPIFAAVSLTNVGRVDTQGFEASLDSRLNRRWRLNVRYSFFDFEVLEQAAEDPIVPNAARHQASAGLSYQSGRLSSDLRLRWTDGFQWRGGIYEGRVPSYEVVDLAVSYKVHERWTLGAQVSNLLDHEHYQIFGGDLLRRRALVFSSFGW